MAYITAWSLCSSCSGLIDKLNKLRLNTLATLFLAAPRKRRAVLTAKYWYEFDKLIFVQQDNDKPEPLVSPAGDCGQLREGGFLRLRSVFVGQQKKAKTLEFCHYESLRQGASDTSPSVSAMEENSTQVTYLATAKFTLLQLLTRSDCLVLEMTSEVVIMTLMMIVVLASVLLLCSVGLTSGVHHTSLAFGSFSTLVVISVVLLIVNKLTMLESHLKEDTLSILQSWRVRLERLRYGVMCTQEDGEQRMRLDSYLCSNLTASNHNFCEALCSMGCSC